MRITAWFARSGVPATGLTPTVNVRRVSDAALVVGGAPMAEIGDGFYSTPFPAFDPNEDYVMVCDGGPTLADFERYCPSATQQEAIVIAAPTIGAVSAASAIRSRELDIIRGDTPTLTFDLGADYTGTEAWYAAKVNPADTEYAIGPIQATWTDAAHGICTVSLTSAQNATVGKFFAELQLRNGDERLTVVQQTLNVKPDVIR